MWFVGDIRQLHHPGCVIEIQWQANGQPAPCETMYGTLTVHQDTLIDNGPNND